MQVMWPGAFLADNGQSNASFKVNLRLSNEVVIVVVDDLAPDQFAWGEWFVRDHKGHRVDVRGLVAASAAKGLLLWIKAFSLGGAIDEHIEEGFGFGEIVGVVKGNALLKQHEFRFAASLDVIRDMQRRVFVHCPRDSALLS